MYINVVQGTKMMPRIGQMKLLNAKFRARRVDQPPDQGGGPGPQKDQDGEDTAHEITSGMSRIAAGRAAAGW